MVYLSWCSVMMYDVVLCLCSITMYHQNCAIMHIYPRWGAGTCVCAREQCTGDGGAHSQFTMFITLVFFHITGYLPPICMELAVFFHFFALFKLYSSSFHSYLHQMPNPKKEMLWNVFVLQCFACLVTSGNLLLSINHILSCSIFMCKCCSSFLWGT